MYGSLTAFGPLWLQDQMAVAYRNLETVFEYLKHIQVR